MKIVEQNDTISLAFVGKLDNGAEFIHATKEKPFSVKIGNSDLPPTVENSLIGLEVGATKRIVVSPDEGYGPRQKDLLQTIDNPDFIKNINPKPGMVISLNVNREGVEHKVPATVIEVNENSAVIDYNHPLAGHNLTYEITILDIVKSVE